MKHAIIISIALGTGCFSYVPAPEASPDQGAEVKVALATPADLPFGQLVVRDAVTVEGFVYEASADTLIIEATWIRNALDERYYANGALYHFSADQVESVASRTFQPAKSVVAGAVVVGAGLGMFTFVAEGGGGNGNGKSTEEIGARVEMPIGR